MKIGNTLLQYKALQYKDLIQHWCPISKLFKSKKFFSPFYLLWEKLENITVLPKLGELLRIYYLKKKTQGICI